MMQEERKMEKLKENHQDSIGQESIATARAFLEALKQAVPTSAPYVTQAEVKLHALEKLRGLTLDLPGTMSIQVRQQPDSVAVLTCPICEERRFVGEDVVDLLQVWEQMPELRDIVEQVFLRHQPCNTVMELRLLTEKEHNLVTVDDLKRIYFRAQDERGRWINARADQASDKQFDTWARSRIEIQGEDMPWLLPERADCNMLWQRDALVMLRKDIAFEDGEEDAR